MIFENEPINTVRTNNKKSYSDYADINTYCREKYNFFIDDLKNHADLSKAREAFNFCKKFEQEDQFYKHALKDGFTEAEKVLNDLQEKIKNYQKLQNEKDTQENRDRLKATDKSKEIFDVKISAKFEAIQKDLEEMYQMQGYRPYMIEKDFHKSIDALYKTAKIMQPRY